MKMECLHGYKAVVKLGAVTFETATVEILGGVCEAAHHCGMQYCTFYDVSAQGDVRFSVALRRAETLAGYLEANMPH